MFRQNTLVRGARLCAALALIVGCGLAEQPVEPTPSAESEPAPSHREPPPLVAGAASSDEDTNNLPAAWIVSPADQSSWTSGTSISFRGKGNDVEDGVLSGTTLVWRSDRDGNLGTGVSFARGDLSVGAHAISLTVTDSTGGTYTDTHHITVAAANQAPVAAISSPAAGSSVSEGTNVVFSGTGTDESGALSGAALVWMSSRDGLIGHGTSFARSNLSVGVHTISLVATDPLGLAGTASTQLAVAALPSSNQPPNAQIVTPAHQSVWAPGAGIWFTGSATDPEDGALTGASITWRSSRDGQIGTGTSFSRSSLSVGTHTITMTSRDSKGLTYSHSRVITVSAQGSSPIASISVTLASASIGVGTSTTASATLRDGAGNIVPGTVTWSSTNSAVASVNAAGVVTGIAQGSASIVAVAGGVSTQRAISVEPAQEQTGGDGAPDGLSPIYSGEIGGWLHDGAFSTVTDGSGTRVGRITYPAGFGGGNSPGQAWKSTGHGTISISTSIKFSSNFQSHSTGINKVMHFFVGGINRIFLMAHGSSLVPSFGLQQLAAPYQGSTATHLMPNLVSGASMARDQWNQIDILLQASGTVSIWLNGTKVLHYTGINFGGSKWEEVKWSPTWGGSGGTVSSTMYMDIAGITLTGRN